MTSNTIKIPTYFKTKFKVISVHFTTDCNLNCPFCYRTSNLSKYVKDHNFFLELIPYIKKLTAQIALGGGEPLLYPHFLKKMGDKCRKEGILFNFTTNGKKFFILSDNEIYNILKNVTMVSISFDYFKWGQNTDQYIELIRRLRIILGASNRKKNCNQIPLISTNLLLDNGMFLNRGVPFLNIVRWLFHSAKVDRIFTLYPKHSDFVDILPSKKLFSYLTEKYDHFYVDELIRKIFEEGYNNWKHPCHFGKDMININEFGEVLGCSFDSEPILILDKPSDLKKIKNIRIKERLNCPFFKPMY